MMHNVEVGLRRMTESDYDAMVRWRQDEEVRKFYSNPHTTYSREMIERKYASRIAGNDKKAPIIVEWDEQPVGYLQYYELDSEEKEEYGLAAHLRMYGMDILIGDPLFRNRGIAARAIRLVQCELEAKSAIHGILLKVHQANGSAIRCYEKCGFYIWKTISDTLLLMLYARGEF
ncbi:acetyltransferase [Paenibacillus rhizovicinus]|uniref:Acetyltransferase n=1 Tax=Paenibacillus rhizovicinus TaxID=2704463 RepID=A0A6C0NY88_9BACL|nr:GNAT family N-acetyltransferase [Paenibacillus rhizovicinus]QHW30906.1 acetyltransferase [Paenibacillus rhizovicinus]